MLKFKNIISLISVITLVLNLSACGGSSEKDEPGFLKFENTPSVLFIDDDGHIANRYNENRTTEFNPSPDYGGIMPFIGKYLTYKLTDKDGEHTVTAPLYGLCTDDGKIIVDPIYNSAEKITLDDGNSFYQLYIDSGVKNRSGKHWAVAYDGSWKIDLGKDSIYSGISGDGTLAFERTRVISKNKTNHYYDFYDLNGKKLFTFEPLQNKSDKNTSLISNFSDGFAAVNETKVDGKTTTNAGYYINKKGEKRFSGFTFAGDFHKGYAIVADKDGLYGVINTKGEYLFEPSFKTINYNPDLGLFACEGDDKYTIYNTKKEAIKTIFAKNSDLKIVGYENKIIEKTSRVTNKSEYLHLETEKPFVFEGTGQFPTEYLGDGLYLCNYSGIGYIFNENGESIVTCEKFGGMVSFNSDYAVAQTKNKDKLIFIDILAKKILNTVEASYINEVEGKGIYLIKSNGKVSIYNAAINKTFLSNCDYAEIITSNKQCFIAVVNNGNIIHYDTKFGVILKFCDGGAK